MLHSSSITIPGVPVFQARMKHAKIGGFIRVYDPKAKEKVEIREFLKGRAYPIFKFPRISFIFYMPIPASMSKKEKALCELGLHKHDKKPDSDNLIKLYLDCLDGIVIHGDQKVSIGTAVKLYGVEPRTVISIIETTQRLSPWEVDFLGVSEFGTLPFSAEDYRYGSYDLWTQVRSLFDRNYSPDHTVLPLA